MMQILFAGIFAAIIVMVLYSYNVKRKDGEAIKELIRETRTAQQRETARLAAKIVRPYYRENSGGKA
ncbi:MAG: hypothetical protein LIP28_00305 [Deltaproteobacteria bacterium]|nr:hypothetical protein [Deltaproteobacteria bacterium]